MELATTLKTQNVRIGVREIGINPDHWYAVAWAKDLKPEQVISVTLWNQPIAIYRGSSGQIYALDNICPHKGVDLHTGDIIGERLVCSYHGWEFDHHGQCVRIPYLPEDQKLPCAGLRAFPIQEKYGLIWVFPGNPTLATERQPPEIPEFDNPHLVMVAIGARFKAHYSICNENTMDVFHGYLHRNLQGWFNPVLLKLRESDDSVCADYRVSYKGPITRFLGLSEDGSSTTTKTISVNYHYPHYYTSLEGISSLYLMRLPVSPSESRSFAFLFLKVRLPQWLVAILRPVLQLSIRNGLFLRFLAQDIEMIESEQRNYWANPQRRYVEINPAIVALQRVLVRQYEQFQQSLRFSQAKGQTGDRHKSVDETVSHLEAIATNHTDPS